MTNTTIINAQSIGGTGASPTQESVLTLQATTSALSLNVLIAAGTALGAEPSPFELCWSTSPFVVTAGEAPLAFAEYSKKNILVNKTGNQRIVSTGPFTANGSTLYVWLNVPTLQAARVVTVTSAEI